MVKELIVSIISFIGYTLHAITGFGGNIIVFPILSALYGSATARVCYISSESVFMLIYGSIIVRVALYKLLAVREINLSRPLLIVVLLIAGIVQGLFVSGGAFLVIYCSQTLKDKKSFRATFTMVWLTIYTGMFFLQLVQGVYS